MLGESGGLATAVFFVSFLLDFHGSLFVLDVLCAPNIEPSSTGRSTVNAVSASYSTLTSAWFSWSSVWLRWLQRVLYHLGYHGRVLPVFKLRYRVSAKTPAWFLLQYPRNSSNHWLVFRPIRLLGLHWHPMIHVNVAPVLVLSPLISSWSLCMLFLPVEDWSCDSFGKRVFLWVACCNRDSFSSSVVCGSEDWLYEVTSCCVIPLGMDETPGYGPHVDEGVGIY